MVLASGPNYGQTKKPMAVNQQVLMNSVDHVLADKSSRDDITVGQLWTVLLCNHMAEILHQNRYSIRKILGICPSFTRKQGQMDGWINDQMKQLNIILIFL